MQAKQEKELDRAELPQRVGGTSGQLEAREQASRTHSDRLSQVLVFEAGKQLHSVPLVDVHEVLCPSTLGTVPNGAEFCKGLGSVRDLVFPVIDFAMLFGQKTPVLAENAVLLFETKKGYVGLFVDRVRSVELLPTLTAGHVASTHLEKSYCLGFHFWNNLTCPCLDLKVFLSSVSVTLSEAGNK